MRHRRAWARHRVAWRDELCPALKDLGHLCLASSKAMWLCLRVTACAALVAARSCSVTTTAVGLGGWHGATGACCTDMQSEEMAMDCTGITMYCCIDVQCIRSRTACRHHARGFMETTVVAMAIILERRCGAHVVQEGQPPDLYDLEASVEAVLRHEGPAVAAHSGCTGTPGVRVRF